MRLIHKPVRHNRIESLVLALVAGVGLWRQRSEWMRAAGRPNPGVLSPTRAGSSPPR